MKLIIIILLLTPLVSAFDFPDLGSFFSNLRSQTESADSETENDSPSPKSRSKRQNIGDEKASDPWEVVSSVLPTNRDGSVNVRYMPTLSNGHIGTAVYSDSIYMEGLYAGSGAKSHRAKIPPTIVGRANFSDPDLARSARRKYSFNARYGLFYENVTTDFAVIQQRMYVHQKYIRCLVVDILAEKRNIGIQYGGGIVQRSFRLINETEDFVFITKPQRYISNWEVKARTVGSEEGAASEQISIYWSDPLTQYSVNSPNPQMETHIMCMDRNEGNAKTEFDNVRGIQSDELLRQHKEAWDAVWNEGRVEIAENININKLSNFAQYYLLSNIPAENPDVASQAEHIHTGLSRTGLAWGGINDLHRGHVMYDSEIYMLPAVLLFHPRVVREVLRYRSGTMDTAKTIAEMEGAQGMHFASESAVSGFDVSKNAQICPKCAWRKYHTTGAIAWAIRQYYSATMDDEYSTSLLYVGCDLSAAIAKFFASRAVFNNRIGRYDIMNVTGPDETFTNVNNNAYTNVLASLAIHWARYYSCICNRNSRDEIPDDWIHKATLLNLPFNNVERLHYPHDGFSPAKVKKVGQADTVMLTFPLNWNMSIDIMRRDLDFYEQLMDDDTPAMTWSWFAVGYKMVKEELKMISYFAQSYQDYVQQPFKVWTEFKEGRGAENDQESSVNFLPGAGAFMQSIIYGFAGIRIRPQTLEFHNPTPPPDSSGLNLYGLKYLGNKMNIFIEQSGRVSIQVLEVNHARPLFLHPNDTSHATQITLREGSYEILEQGHYGFYIYTDRISGCEHPRDYIFMPWGYSPYIDSASLATPSLVAVVTISLATFLLRLW